MKHCSFKVLSKEMGSEFEVLLYRFNVRRLSRGKELNRVFAMLMELARFLRDIVLQIVHSLFGVHGRYFRCSL
uniref:Uncharacterized protein n=1 Tax=Lepeophtheirus salmonis TaxID=72036 RepID=A0A0K2UD67_LEPSM